MGKKTKSHRKKVARRNHKIYNKSKIVFENYISDMLQIRNMVWNKVKENGFSTVEEAWENAPEIFLDVFPGEDTETIENALNLDWIKKQ